MRLDDELRAVLDEEAAMRTATPPDVSGLISGGRARRRRRNAMRAVVGVLAAVIAVGSVYGVAQLRDADSVGGIAHQPPLRLLPSAREPVAIDPGEYVVPGSADVVAPYSITVPAGWDSQYGTVVGKRPTRPDATGIEPGGIVIEPFALDRIRLTRDTCRGERTLGAPQTSVSTLVAGLRAQGSALRVSDPVADTVGGLAATRIDLAYPGSTPLTGCRLSAETAGGGPGWLQVWSGYFVMFPGESASVYVVDVGDRVQVLVTRTRDDASPGDRAELQSILDSVTFGVE